MTTIRDVAQYFLRQANQEDDTGISNLKLQKLLYYTQAFHLAMYDKPFFPEDFYAWTHGPVCPEIYHEYKKFGAGPITLAAEALNAPLADFTPLQYELLEEVGQVYGQFSAWKLRNMTHDDAPWQEQEASGGLIDKAGMAAFYKSRLA